jgi:hypothetical protein
LTLGSAVAAPARLATRGGPFWLPARPEPLPEKAITSVDLNAAPKPGPSRQLNSPGGSSIRRGSALEPDGWGQAGSDHTTCWPESALLRQTATAVSESPSPSKSMAWRASRARIPGRGQRAGHRRRDLGGTPLAQIRTDRQRIPVWSSSPIGPQTPLPHRHHHQTPARLIWGWRRRQSSSAQTHRTHAPFCPARRGTHCWESRSLPALTLTLSWLPWLH